jgi:hypothetical protein
MSELEAGAVPVESYGSLFTVIVAGLPIFVVSHILMCDNIPGRTQTLSTMLQEPTV